MAYSHHWAYKSGVTCSLDCLRTRMNISRNECCGPVSLLVCHVSMAVPLSAHVQVHVHVETAPKGAWSVSHDTS